ncbi:MULTISPECIES: hypothetical protein [Nitrosomonas]|nr:MULTISPECIES: hypothetical protein [Nitrosomonas]
MSRLDHQINGTEIRSRLEKYSKQGICRGIDLSGSRRTTAA